MQYLVNNGVKYGENGITSTTGHHRSWYLTECNYCMNLLNKFRKSRLIEK